MQLAHWMAVTRQVCPDLRGFSQLLYLDRTLDVG